MENLGCDSGMEFEADSMTFKDCSIAQNSKLEIIKSL